MIASDCVSTHGKCSTRSPYRWRKHKSVLLSLNTSKLCSNNVDFGFAGFSLLIEKLDSVYSVLSSTDYASDFFHKFQ